MFIILVALLAMTINSKIKTCGKHITLLLLLSNATKTQASTFHAVWKEATYKTQKSKINCESKNNTLNKKVSTKEKMKNRNNSVFAKNNINNFPSTTASNTIRHSLYQKNSNYENLLKKLEERRIQIEMNEKMISLVNKRIKRLMRDYKEMTKQQKGGK